MVSRMRAADAAVSRAETSHGCRCDLLDGSTPFGMVREKSEAGNVNSIRTVS